MTRITSRRRTFIGSIVVGTGSLLSGCTDMSDSTGNGTGSDYFDEVVVDETALVFEFVDDHPLEKVTVIDPSGEEFAVAELAAGVERETIDLGTEYEFGEFEVIGTTDGEEAASTTITIEPDVQLTELLLGRNHPDEMHEEISESRAPTEVIITLENNGTGPDAAVNLDFSGDIPGPTDDDFEESGIFETEDDIEQYADKVVLPPEESTTIYSQSQPFTLATGNVSCSPDTESGEFETIVEIEQENQLSHTYDVSYTGEDMEECEIEIEEHS